MHSAIVLVVLAVSRQVPVAPPIVLPITGAAFFRCRLWYSTAMESYTLITGASSGIGKALAYEFAKHGYNVVLVARRYHELEQIAADITEQHKVEAKFYAADLLQPQEREALESWVNEQGILVEVLVNNAGFGYVGEFKNQDRQRNVDMIELNCKALTDLTHRFLPTMVQMNHGKILHTASVAAFMPGPLQAVYFATKAYVKSFSHALGYELRATNVTVTALCPGPVATHFTDAAGITNLGMFKNAQSPEQVASIAYKALMSGKREVITHGKLKFLIKVLQRFMPMRLQLWWTHKLQEHLAD